MALLTCQFVQKWANSGLLGSLLFMIGVFGDLWGNYCNGSSFACKDSVQQHLACHWLETSCCTCRQWSFCNQPSWKTCVHPGVAVHAASFSIKIIQNHNLHKSGRIQMDTVQFVFFKKRWSLEQDLSLLPHACMHAGHTLLFQTLQSVIQSIGWRRRQEDDYQRWKDFVVSNRRDLRLRDNLGKDQWRL